ncbi:MAG: hypothetical protein IJW40_07665 [Clostridia bacterium]|nr:hypothetical protein [Clostridia bacterium]
MKKATKLLCLFLAFLMSVSMFVACADEGTDDDKDPDQSTPSTTEPNEGDGGEETSDLLLTLPSYDFNEEEFVILCRTDKEYEVDTENPSTGDIVNDAIFSRNARVEELYNVEIVSAPVNGTWDQQSVFTSTLKNAVSSGSEDFDLVAGYLAYISNLAMDDCFYNLHEVNTLNLESEWWSESFVDNLTLFDCLYFADGDISLTMWESLYAMYFNKQIAEDRGIDNLYEMVIDGEWTMEALYELTEELYEDDGNDTVDMGDSFGMIINCHSIRAMVTTCGIPITQRNDEGTYDLVFFEDNTVNLFDELYSYVHSNDSVYMMVLSDDSDYTDILKMFTNNQSLFISGTLDQSATLRNMDTAFGIVPFPKYDKYQDNYLSHSYDGHSIFSIPASLVDPSMSGAIMDALGAESKQSVVPQYYEVVLKGRTTRDEESREMLDIIRDNLHFDFGFVYSVYMDRIYSHFGDLIEGAKNTFASSYVSTAEAYELKLEEIIEQYEGIS